MECPCCSGKPFETCCEPILTGELKADTSEQLMRSRYTAYTRADADYILATTHVSTRKQYSAKSISEWAKSSTWLKLEVKAVTENTVSFYAYFLDEKGTLQIHKEHSHFTLENGTWYFVEGEGLQ